MDIDAIRDVCRRRGYDINTCDIFDRGLDTLVIGEQHYNPDHQDGQEELIRLVKPRVVLHEFHDPTTTRAERIARWTEAGYSARDIERALVRSEAEQARIAAWQRAYGFELVPGDVTDAQSHALRNGLEELLVRTGVYAALPDGAFPVTAWERLLLHTYSFFHARELVDAAMGIKLREQLEQGKRPVIAIYGSHHVRPESDLHHVLRGRLIYPLAEGQNYITVLQQTEADRQARGFFTTP